MGRESKLNEDRKGPHALPATDGADGAEELSEIENKRSAKERHELDLDAAENRIRDDIESGEKTLEDLDGKIDSTESGKGSVEKGNL